jgi:uncharacterized membrane protein
MIWIVAIILVLVLLAFLKFEHYNKTWHTLLAITLILFVYLSMTAMIKTGKMDFSSPRAVINSFTIYGGWLSETGFKLFDIGKDTIRTIGNAIRINQTDKGK